MPGMPGSSPPANQNRSISPPQTNNRQSGVAVHPMQRRAIGPQRRSVGPAAPASATYAAAGGRQPPPPPHHQQPHQQQPPSQAAGASGGGAVASSSLRWRPPTPARARQWSVPWLRPPPTCARRAPSPPVTIPRSYQSTDQPNRPIHCPSNTPPGPTSPSTSACRAYTTRWH